MATTKEILKQIKDHHMVFQEVHKSFATCTNFSEAYIPMRAVRETVGTEHSKKCMTFGALFDLDIVDERVPNDVKQLLERTTPWPKMSKKTCEEDAVVNLAQQLFLPLFGEVIFELGYKDYVKYFKGMKAQRIGIGSQNTLHGTPDARLGLVPCLFTTSHSVEGEEEEGEDEEEEEEDKALSGFGSNGKDQLQL